MHWQKCSHQATFELELFCKEANAKFSNYQLELFRKESHAKFSNYHISCLIKLCAKIRGLRSPSVGQIGTEVDVAVYYSLGPPLRP